MDNSKTELEKLGSVLFGNETGQKFLKELTKTYLIDYPVAPHSCNSSFAFYREGENNLVRVLIKIGGQKNE